MIHGERLHFIPDPAILADGRSSPAYFGYALLAFRTEEVID
jgi:hypothetical protein